MTPQSGRAGRAAWGSISRATVVAAAVEMVLADEAGEVSIRGLAARLDVSPMALYRHVESKEDLLDAVVDRLFADRWEPAAPRTDWRAWLIEAAERLRAFLVEHPAALRVYLARPVVSATAMARMTASLEVLRDHLGGDARARGAYAAVHTYTIGFAALEAAREASAATSGAHDVSDAERELAAFASPTQFRTGLAYLVAGFADGSDQM